MTLGSFKVFAFDGLRGYGEAVRGVGTKPGKLAVGSVVRLIPERGPTEDWETTPWTTRLVYNCSDEYGMVQLPLAVDRRIVLRLVVDQVLVEGSPASGTEPALVRTKEDTTVSLREPVTLNAVYNTAHTGDLFGPFASDIDVSNLGEGCKGTQTLGVDVQVALPRGVLLEVLEAAPGSSSWLLSPGDDSPHVPTDEASGTRSRIPVWVPVAGAVILLGVTGWLLFGGGGHRVR